MTILLQYAEHYFNKNDDFVISYEKVKLYNESEKSLFEEAIDFKNYFWENIYLETCKLNNVETWREDFNKQFKEAYVQQLEK